MKHCSRIGYFSLGLFLGVFISITLITPKKGSVDIPQDVTSRKPTALSTDLNAARAHKKGGRLSSAHGSGAIRDLQLELFSYAGSEPFTELLQRLSLSQLQSVSQSLTAFQEELKKHEERTAQIVLESDERCVLEIPAMPENADARLRLMDQLQKTLGADEAEMFLQNAPEGMLSRFSGWGQCEHEIMINLAVDPPYVAINAGGDLYGYHYNKEFDRFAHIFEIMEPND